MNGCMQAHYSIGHSSAGGSMADFRIESTDIPTATVPASQLNGLRSWYPTSMCILHPLSVEMK